MNSRGFTLIEILAALSIAGLILLGATLLLDQLTDAGARIARDGRTATEEGNAERVLRQLLMDARVTVDTADRFRGDESSLDFTTMCRASGGWMETCRAALAIDHRGDSSVVFALLPGDQHIELTRYSEPVVFRYFDLARTDSSWVTRWPASIVIPSALGIVRRSDTIVFAVGPRR